MPTQPIPQVLRLRDVVALTGRARATIYEDMRAGRLPRAIKLGPRAVGWLRSDIDQWLSERVAARDNTSGAGQ